MKELQPIIDSPEVYDYIEEELEKIFREEIYLPLVKSIGNSSKIFNAFDDLLSAIRTGRIWFYRGEFKGKFNASISRELKKLGASWDRKHGTWKVPRPKLSAEVKTAIDASELNFSRKLQQIDSILQSIVPEEVSKKVPDHLFDKALWKTEKSFKQTIKTLGVTPNLTEEGMSVISKDYTNNMKLYIKEWTEKEIISLREKMKTNTFGGSRYEGMFRTIQRSYGVSKNKAKFLARQETNLLMAKFKEVRYGDAGITHYKWKTVIGSANHPVRPMHKKLDGKIFRFDSPPIVDENGNRKNPGEDYGCRCTAIPLVTF